jgi:hypothetical protein
VLVIVVVLMCKILMLEMDEGWGAEWDVVAVVAEEWAEE